MLRLRPRVPAGYALRTHALLEAGKDLEAMETIDAAIAEKSASPELWQQLGLTLLELRHADVAVARLGPEVQRGGGARLRSVYGVALRRAGPRR